MTDLCFIFPLLQLWYHLSKTVAELEAWKFAKEHGLDLVTINPAMVVGRLLQQSMNITSEIISKLLDGNCLNGVWHVDENSWRI